MEPLTDPSAAAPSSLSASASRAARSSRRLRLASLRFRFSSFGSLKSPFSHRARCAASSSARLNSASFSSIRLWYRSRFACCSRMTYRFGSSFWPTVWWGGRLATSCSWSARPRLPSAQVTTRCTRSSYETPAPASCTTNLVMEVPSREAVGARHLIPMAKAVTSTTSGRSSASGTSISVWVCAEASDQAPKPIRFTARTRNWYGVPAVRPVTTLDRSAPVVERSFPKSSRMPTRYWMW
mmetsp:Transcript_21385/g.48256  ORF Transcript_21385/g.48256 Transcript_21385/m.48256 type:complete len:239 (-) Transcript_21385:1425-2141(-)